MDDSVVSDIWVWMILYLRVSGNGGCCTLGYQSLVGTVP